MFAGEKKFGGCDIVGIFEKTSGKFLAHLCMHSLSILCSLIYFRGESGDWLRCISKVFPLSVGLASFCILFSPSPLKLNRMKRVKYKRMDLLLFLQPGPPLRSAFVPSSYGFAKHKVQYFGKLLLLCLSPPDAWGKRLLCSYGEVIRALTSFRTQWKTGPGGEGGSLFRSGYDSSLGKGPGGEEGGRPRGTKRGQK